MSWMERKKKKMQPSKVNILNTPYLVIVESPSKCAKIETFLGFQYKCIASKGHLREISKVSKKYEIEYKIIEERSEHVKDMRNIVEYFKKENIYIATDDDREGEAIGWHICELFDLPLETTKRILFHEVTETALKKAILSPIHIRMNIVIAQQTRQVLDRLIGFKISPLLTQFVVSEKNLSAGRCQTPILRLLWDLDVSTCKQDCFYYEVTGTFSHSPFLLTGTLNKTFPETEKEKIKEFLEKSKIFPSKLKIEKSFMRNESSPQPFNTSSLLQTASTQLHMCPTKTMNFLQLLYQDGYITYMRTESKKYSSQFIVDIQTWISLKYGETFYTNENRIEENKNAHEAIRVTNLSITEDHMEESVKTLYHLIWKRTIQSCMKDYQCNITPIRISAPNNCFYESEKEETVFLGWKIMNSHSLKTPNMDLTYLKSLNEKEFQYTKILGHLKIENKERHYTEASLISKMESIGIGRPSTYALLVNTLQERNYIKKESFKGKTRKGMDLVLEKEQIQEKEIMISYGEWKQKLCIQDLGKEIIQLLYFYFSDLFNYDYTRKMEEELDKIVESQTPQKSFYHMCESCNGVLDQCIQIWKEKMKKEYQIDRFLIVFSKKGPILKSMDDPTIYKTIRSDIFLDLEKLEKGKYKLEDIQEIPCEPLGIYESFPLYLKKGPYGFYVEWGEKRKSIKLKSDFTFEKILVVLENTKKDSLGVLRELEKHCDIRKGKYGPYVNYLEEKKRVHISLKTCSLDYLSCDKKELMDWILTELEKRRKDI